MDFGKKALFSILDLKDAFHQVLLREDSRPLTCTSTPIGSIQWKVVVMGLKNGVPIFQRVVDHCLRPVRDVAAGYVDDVLVGTDWAGSWEATINQHDKDIKRVLNQFKVCKLVVDKKLKLLVREVEFCGHVLGGGKRRPAPGKLMAVEKWEPPKTVTQLRGFLGFTNYYSAYIRGYAAIVAPLQDLLKVTKIEGRKGSKAPVNFQTEHNAAFLEIKSRLLQGLALHSVKPDQPFVLRVDASNRAVGAALEQFEEKIEGMPTPEQVLSLKRVPVAFCSRKLAPGQVKWTPREKETYAIITALLKWASWINYQPLLILTDHKSLESWHKELLDTPSGPAGRRYRWHELLFRFDVHVEYVPGRENVVADALSR